MRVGLSIPVMDEPAALVELGVGAERNGWDGVFLWHHVVGTPDFAVPMADAWVVLGALAVRTQRVRLGTTITALPRHQPQEVARQAVTVDRLSGGRMVLGVGLGEPPAEYTAIGRTADRRALASMLDEGLGVVSGLWTGEPFSHSGEHYTFDGVQFLPTPVQQPRIPIWASAMSRNERTLGRAARWDGVLLGAMTAEDGMAELPAEAVAAVAARPDAPADVVVAVPPGTDPARYDRAGATWVLVTGWLDELRELAAAPPPGGSVR
jgi:alkanesulfonate monooxygenase SsuD/methylene tetrahydromethanopterin reductase-like flavin-dependent oxidoreductase (luciferase family)